MTPHLGSWVSALVDGQLDPAASERCLAHVAACARCADELEAARAARRALLGAADVTPAPDLAERLLALSTTIPPTDGDPLRDPLREPAWEVPEAWRTTLTGDLAERRRRRHRRRLVAAGAGGVGVLGCALFALGQAPVVTPDPSRSAAFTLLAHAGAEADAVAQTTAGPEGSAADGSNGLATAWLDEQGWVLPSDLPAGYEVTAVRVLGDGRGAVELDVEGPYGPVVVREQRGRLSDVTAAAGQAGDDALEGAGHDIEVLSSDPWHVAWQCGDVVVDVAADLPEDVLADVVAAFPGRGYDAGVLPRISRGWTTVTGALSRP